MKKNLQSETNGEFTKFYGKTKAINMVKSLVYRWFQLYERPLTLERINCQMELLSDNVRILTSLGAISKKEQFPTLLEVLENPKSAYHVGDINVYPCGVRMYTAQTIVSYQTKDANGETKSYNLSFEADIQNIEDLSFKFLRIKIKTLNATQDTFTDAYPINRSNALIHRCMGLIEYNVTDVDTLSCCFLSEFEVYPIDHEPLVKEDELISWIAEVNTLLGGVSISPVNLNVKQIAFSEHEYLLEFDLLFEGKNSSGELKNSLSKNIWIVHDDPNDYLPKIKSILAEKLEPIFI